MAGASAVSPVALAWVGLSLLGLSVAAIVAVREPVFASVDRPAAPGETAEADGKRAAPPPADRDPQAKPAAPSSAKSPDWALPFGDTSARPAGLPGAELREAQKAFEDRVRKNDLRGALTALEALVAVDEDAIKEPSTKEQVIELSQRVMLLTGGEPERMFTVLAQRSGPTGVDILYYLVTAKGGSKAAKVAESLLGQEEVVARGSKAMRVAWRMRKTPCAERKALFSDAAESGDARVLGMLYEMNRRCGRRSRGCCMHKDAGLERTIDAIEARLKK